MNRYPLGQSSPLTRRRFLASAATAAVASGLPRALTAQPVRRRFVIREDRFGRMFPGLEPFFRGEQSAPPGGAPRHREARRHAGRAGRARRRRQAGGDQPDRRPRPEREQPEQPDPHGGHHVHGPVHGSRHDLRPDLAAGRGRPSQPTRPTPARRPSTSTRSTAAGRWSTRSSTYAVPASRERPTKLRIESGGLFEDLPRNGDRTAIIADPRNDENMIIAGLQAAFILFHNKAVDLVRERDRRLSSDEVFQQGAPAHDLALPVDDRSRVPAALHRPGDGERHPPERAALLPAPGRVHPRRVPGRRVPLRPQHGPSLLPREPRRRRTTARRSSG